ncbi:MAG: Clp protease ClpP [Synergistaceae bacterium]|nr:Clp protease ClpP [Synergistaceae bacterium]
MYKIINHNGNNEILLYSLIDYGITANKVIDAVNSFDPDKTITLRINSEGGDVFDGIALYNYLKDRNVNVIIDGECSSSASIIAMAGKTITMKRGSLLMIHNPMTCASGDSEAFKAYADMLGKITSSVIAIYQSRSNLNADQIRDLMAAETWLEPEMAKEYGFIDDFESVTFDEALNGRYDEGVRAERERIRELDEMYTPARAIILNKAKYIDPRSARDVALEILRAEAKNTALHPNGISLPSGFSDQMMNDTIDSIISRKRGF